MLAVITDDFTGASEIGGTALARGLRAVIETRDVSCRDTDVLVIASDMRSLDPESARAKSRRLTERLLELGPELIFKKVDSVLRGNIVPELVAQMRVEGKSRALLVPANPSRGRIVDRGTYYVEGSPIAESAFARAYPFWARTSRVVDTLRAGGACDIFSVSPGQPLDAPGVHVGDARNADDLRAWAERVADGILPGGGADFFAAVLEARLGVPAPAGTAHGYDGDARTLLICGSSFPSSRGAVQQAQAGGFRVLGMPDEIYFRSEIDPALIAAWAERVAGALQRGRKAVITAPQAPGPDSLEGRKVSEALAEVARHVVADHLVDELMIEGGATAQAVLNALDVSRLHPLELLGPGVTRMKADGCPDLHVTMKPGSYGWPDLLWHSAGQPGKTGGT